MKISQFLKSTRTVVCLHSDITVETTAGELLRSTCSTATTLSLGKADSKANSITLAVLSPDEAATKKIPCGDRDEWMFARASETNGIELYVSHTWFLYRLACRLTDDWLDEDLTYFSQGKLLEATFKHLRPAYDSLLNNHARTTKGFDPEDHIREMARQGYTHVEVNGFAANFPYEKAAPGELLYLFYTYCAALDQFVYSKLNKGIYPYDYLQANLNKLKHSAQLAEKYGLRAGILSFEPRSVPDELLERYPMLRGARVDHPLRSFRPRYNLTTAHPVVLDHYSEMLGKIMEAAPNIDYMTIWSNDSGAGFEYTSSLYVGRNGGGYVIREFKGDDAIAEAAADNIIRFMKTIRDAGRNVNPKFNCVLRSEMFYAEQDYLWDRVEDGIELETNTLVSKGFNLDYKHPKYDWAVDFTFSGLFNQFAKEEKPKKELLESRGSNAHLYFSPGSFWNMEPVKAPMYPKLLWEKLRDLHQQEVSHTAGLCGSTPSTLAPYNVNQEILRSFQNDPSVGYDEILTRQATRWVGATDASKLVETWNHADEAYRSYPPPVSVMAIWSTWYRVLVRPFVPNFEALSETDRAYYEDFHLGHANNRVRTDFRREINFDFCTPQYAGKCREAISDNVLPEIEAASELAREGRDGSANESGGHDVWSHHFDRLYGAKCWFRTQRNIAAWIEGVHGYIEAEDASEKKRCRALVRHTVLDEKENARDLLQHVESAQTEWMIESELGETTFIYGDNIAELLRKKIALMEGREDDEPFVDPDFMWRVPGINC
jgi:hypothetical protein|tara:strand:+ start:110 stop:2428 length:2319 start_codon:yes stop_codon:yes gene_type:complete